MIPTIDAVFVGGPKHLTDARGEWQSSIARRPHDGPVSVNTRGISGDQVTQPYHGGPDAALCAHLADHYRFWQEQYGLSLAPGVFGENLTLGNITEHSICAGDIVRLGTVLAQVSGPRVPCANLARHIGRPDWVKLTIRENRTGFYLRVLEPGTLQSTDPWLLQQRFDEEASIPKINDCMFLHFNPTYAARMQHMVGLGDWWREQASKKFAAPDQHWTSRLQQE